MKNTNLKIGGVIKQYRENILEMTVNELSYKMELSANAIRYWESGDTAITLANVTKFQSLLPKKHQKQFAETIKAILLE